MSNCHYQPTIHDPLLTMSPSCTYKCTNVQNTLMSGKGSHDHSWTKLHNSVAAVVSCYRCTVMFEQDNQVRWQHSWRWSRSFHYKHRFWAAKL